MTKLRALTLKEIKNLTVNARDFSEEPLQINSLMDFCIAISEFNSPDDAMHEVEIRNLTGEWTLPTTQQALQAIELAQTETMEEQRVKRWFENDN